MRRHVIAVVVAALVAVGCVVTAAPAQAATHQVGVDDNVFTPKVLEIDPGDTVTWTAVRAGHTITADDGSFDFDPGRALNAGEQRSVRFDTEKDVRYHCKIHGGPGGQGMSGLIRVGNPPPPPVPAVPTLIVPDDVATLRDAATGAAPGTQVLVRPGVYREEVVVTVPGLDIRGMGARPEDVTLDGEDRLDTGITVAAPGVRIANLAVKRFGLAGIVVDGVARTVVADTVLHANGLHGVNARAPAGVTLRALRVTGHGIAGIAVRDCVTCGALIDGVTSDGNAAGIVAADTTGVVVRASSLTGNAVGIVLRNASGSRVYGNTLTDNDATDVWIAAVTDGPEQPNGAGVWVHGGRANVIAGNTATGHTYNVAVTGPIPALDHRVVDNTVSDSTYADLGWDGLGARVCFSGNDTAADDAATAHPPVAPTLYSCEAPAPVGIPYPVVTANLAAHARASGHPV